MTIHQVVGFPGRAEMRAVSLRAGFELSRVGLADRCATGCFGAAGKKQSNLQFELAKRRECHDDFEVSIGRITVAAVYSMLETRNPIEQFCANCGFPRSAEYCGQCGQHERGSRRLQTRDIAANCAEALLDVESPLPATLIGLIRNPGRMCLDYVNGRRKRYMNPFALLLVAVTAQIILSAVLQWTGWIVPTPDESDALPDEALNCVLFAIVVPLAFLWTKLFAASDRNFAENYVLGLYLLGQFAWLELVLLPLTRFAVAESILLIAYPIVWLIMATWAGAVFYSMKWYSVFWRMFASTAATLIVAGGLVVATLEAIAFFRPSEIVK